jgi:flagellar hook-associated protein 2
VTTIADTTSSALSSSILASLKTLSGTTSNVGANLNVSSLVAQLVAADRAPDDARLNLEQAHADTEISALGSLKGALSTFQTVAQALANPAAFNVNATTSSNNSILTATSNATAATGSYIVQVTALAQAHQLSSAAIAGGSTATVGTGTLTIGQGSKSFAVNIDSTNNTLAAIAAAINSATGNTGVQATILNATDGSHLVLTASQTGAASAVSVTASGGDGGLVKLDYDSTTKNMIELQAAQDSSIQIAGYTHTSASNSVTDAVTGLTLNLLSAAPGTSVTVSVTPNTSNTNSLVSSFVSAYNQLQSVISGLVSYDPATKTAGPMLGDATLSGIENQLRVTLSKTVSGASGAYKTLASIGVTKQADGTLALDSAKLSTALAQTPDSVGQVFASKDGVATTLNSVIATQLQPGGVLDSRNTQLQQTLTQVRNDTAALDERMAAVQANYTAQFTALETLLAQLQTMSSYLTQQFNVLQNMNSKSGA